MNQPERCQRCGKTWEEHGFDHGFTMNMQEPDAQPETTNEYPHTSEYRNCGGCNLSFAPITSDAVDRYKFCGHACEYEQSAPASAPTPNTATDNLRANPYEIASELDADEYDAEFRAGQTVKKHPPEPTRRLAYEPSKDQQRRGGEGQTAEQFHKEWRKGMHISDGQRDFYMEMEAYAASQVSASLADDKQFREMRHYAQKLEAEVERLREALKIVTYDHHLCSACIEIVQKALGEDAKAEACNP